MLNRKTISQKDSNGRYNGLKFCQKNLFIQQKRQYFLQQIAYGEGYA